MSNRNYRGLLIGLSAGVSLAALATAAYAQDVEPGAESEVGEIVVMAQRRAQNIQDVPSSITAVTSEQVQDLNIFNFEDVDQLAPGLQLDSGGGFNASASLRGVGFNSQASTDPAVDIYFNETPLDANYAFQAMYDIGQIEILRGPQGTLRGRPSPAGAVTLTTRRPDLSEYGGSVSLSASDQDSFNTWAAVNVPLIKDRLALRVAGLWDKNDGEQVRSINGAGETGNETESWRASLRWALSDDIEVGLTHQRLHANRVLLTQVTGDDGPAGAPGQFAPFFGIFPAAINANDAPITERGFAVQDQPSTLNQNSNLTILNVAWDLGSNRLIYTGAYQDNHFLQVSDLDSGNAVEGGGYQTVNSFYRTSTHELRLQSEGERFMDYTVGYWRQATKTSTPGDQPASAVFAGLGGVNFEVQTDLTNQAVFGNLVFHLSDATDLSVGARYLELSGNRSDFLETPGPSVFRRDRPVSENAFVYNASLSHDFTDDVMGYVSYGHSWRPGGVSVAITSSLVDDEFIFAPPEESDSFELGVKSQWFDRSVRLNAAVFHQDFENFVGRFNGIDYLSDSATTGVGNGGFSYGADAVVDGAEVEFAWNVSDDWSLQVNWFTADGRYDNVAIPCNDSDQNGVPDNGVATPASFAGTGGVNLCVSGDPTAATANWGLTLQSEYVFPVFGKEGYVRGLYVYAPENRNFGSGANFQRDSFGVLNLYAGLRSTETNWEVGLWAKNVLDDDTVTAQGATEIRMEGLDTGYRSISYVPAREIGVSLRYGFGGG